MRPIEYLYLRQNLSEYTKSQTPQFGTIRDPDLDRGDIVFRSVTPTPRKISISSSSSNTSSNNSPRSQPNNLQPSQPTKPPTIPRNLTLIAAKPNQNQDQMYQRLEQFLAQQDFRKADEQTWELMKQVGNGGNETYLTVDEIKNFSCPALRKMDEYWVKYSQGKFGFSVQKDIWESVGSNPNADLFTTYRRFAIKVGWKTGSDQNSDGYKSYEEMTFSLNAKEGHLPRRYGNIYEGKLTAIFLSRVPCRV